MVEIHSLGALPLYYQKVNSWPYLMETILKALYLLTMVFAVTVAMLCDMFIETVKRWKKYRGLN